MNRIQILHVVWALLVCGLIAALIGEWVLGVFGRLAQVWP